jgi:hypothetical protein
MADKRQPMPTGKEDYLRELLELAAQQQATLGPAAQQAQQQAMVAQGGPASLARPAIMRSKEHGFMGQDPVSAGNQAWESYQELQPLIDEYRRAQARKLMETLFMRAPMAQR